MTGPTETHAAPTAADRPPAAGEGLVVAALLAVAAVVRVALVGWGFVQDALLAVRYTDVDYDVFGDAAKRVLAGGSPYERATYRYSPLVAAALLPDAAGLVGFGKLAFAAGDVLAGRLLVDVLRARGVSANGAALWVGALWLFNPFTLTISTRGNCEGAVGLLMVFVLRELLAGRLRPAAAAFGVAVHVRVYPVLYTLPVLVFLDRNYPTVAARHAATGRPAELWRRVLSPERVEFAAVSGGTFLALGAACYALYGWPFVREAYLYHLTRSDPRHNFAPHFYPAYLSMASGGSTGLAAAAGAVAKLSQPALCVWLGYAFGKDLPFALFVQTLVFVAFNSVATAQYFAWYFLLAPLALPSTRLSALGGLGVAVLWSVTQLHWLGWAYLLEFQGWNVFLPLWGASLAFFAANVFAICVVVAHHSYVPVFKDGVVQRVC